MSRATTNEVHSVFRFDRADSCIYCGSKTDLTDEHVIPFALFGNIILPNASCRLCAQITSAFEGRVLRGFMFSARVAGDFPTRHPKKRPRTLPLTTVRDEVKSQIDVEPSAHLGLMQLPIFAPPGAATESVVGMETLSFGMNPEDVAKTVNAATVRQTDELDLVSFARLLSKIAYSYAVGCVGEIERSRVFLLPFMLGSTASWGGLLGSQVFKLKIEEMNPTHALAHCWVRHKEDPSKEFLVIRIKLFVNLNTTGYEVVVCDRNVGK